MPWIATKYIITAGLVVIVSEVAKRSDRLGGFLAALPLVTLLVLVWLHIENQPQSKIANHAWYTFWYVVPTLPMFIIFPYLLPKMGFWLSFFSGIGITMICFGVFGIIVRQFGIEIL